jgi:hypothetical protein
MQAGEVERLFTRADGTFFCARWGRPVVPVVFGVDDRTLGIVKGAIEAVVAHAGHRMAETDPELGANLMLFFFRDWAELKEVPNLDRLLPGLGDLCDRLAAVEANQFRTFRFDGQGAIKAAFVFLRMDRHMQAVSAEALALAQAVQALLTWSDRAFAAGGVLLRGEGGAEMVQPEVAEVLRAAYDPVLPAASREPAHALRLAARIGRRSS